MGRAEVINGGNSKKLSVAEIRRLPLGALADAFFKLKSQNSVESFLCSALKRINPERIMTAHRTGDSQYYGTEA
jgi:gluconate kinase